MIGSRVEGAGLRNWLQCRGVWAGVEKLGEFSESMSIMVTSNVLSAAALAMTLVFLEIREFWEEFVTKTSWRSPGSKTLAVGFLLES